MANSHLILALLILLKGENHAPSQNVVVQIQAPLLQDCLSYPCQKRAIGTDARWYPALINGLLPPSGGVEITPPDEKWQTPPNVE